MDENKQIQPIIMASAVIIVCIYLVQFVQRMMIARAAVPVAPEAYGSYWLSPQGHIMNIDYTEEGEPSYIGEAYPGTGNDEAGWRIYRYEYELVDGDWMPMGIRFAGGNTNFDKVWDDRGEYEYS